MEDPFLSFIYENIDLKRKNKCLRFWLLFISFICFVTNVINIVCWLLI